jgi:hypothetical protein
MHARSASSRRTAAWLPLLLALALVPTQSGCLHLIAATGMYLWEGGNLVPADFDGLKDKKVVVFCRPPASQEFRQAGASRAIAKRVSDLLEINVPGIEVIPQKQVDNWVDENDSDDFAELGKAVKADLIVHVELGHFELFKGKTVYQGNADVTVSVHDVNDKNRLVWDKPMGEVLFPVHSGIAVQDKPVQQFQREFVEVLSQEVSMHFYKHDPHANFAIDAIANK